MTYDAYRYTYLNDPNATGGQGPNGTWTNGVEHPWSTGNNFRIFYTPGNVAPVLNNSSMTPRLAVQHARLRQLFRPGFGHQRNRCQR